jgi:hypothetical protein
MPIFRATTGRDIVPQDSISAGLIICWLSEIKSWLLQPSGSEYNRLSRNKTEPVMFLVLSLWKSEVCLDQLSNCIFSALETRSYKNREEQVHQVSVCQSVCSHVTTVEPLKDFAFNLMDLLENFIKIFHRLQFCLKFDTKGHFIRRPTWVSTCISLNIYRVKNVWNKSYRQKWKIYAEYIFPVHPEIIRGRKCAWNVTICVQFLICSVWHLMIGLKSIIQIPCSCPSLSKCEWVKKGGVKVTKNNWLFVSY